MINYRVFETPQDVVVSLAETMMTMSHQIDPVHISLSGGSTPKLLFKVLSQAPFAQEINWNNLHFWWGDERCVAPTDPESNFGEANTLLFENITIPSSNIHRIHGEADPVTECARFAAEMNAVVPHKNGLPAFDWILLGMGEDGHTASLFPNKTNFDDPALAVIATQPQTGQLRISKTARLLENADRITYLVLGESKASVLQAINNELSETLVYPAAKIKASHGETEWYLDAAAAKLLAQGE